MRNYIDDLKFIMEDQGYDPPVEGDPIEVAIAKIVYAILDNQGIIQLKLDALLGERTDYEHKDNS